MAAWDQQPVITPAQSWQPAPPQQQGWASPPIAGGAPRPGMAYVQPWGQEAAASYFTDPLHQPIMQAWSNQMEGLQQWNAPNLRGLEDLYTNAAKPNKYYDRAANALSQMLGSRAGATNPYTGQYAAAVEARKKQLNAEPFSTSEDAALKARYFDSLSASRDDRAQQMAEMLAQRGFANSSGLAGDAMGEVEQSYQTDRAQQQQQLMQYVMDTRESRRNLAVDMAGGLANQGYHDATLAAQNLAQRGNLAGALAQLAQAQQQAQFQSAQGIGGLRQQSFVNEQGLYNQALQASQLPYQLQNQSLQNLTAMLGGVPNPQNQMNTMAQQQAQRDQYNAQVNAQMMQGIGQAAAGGYGAYTSGGGGWGPSGTNPGTGHNAPGEVWGSGVSGIYPR